MQFDRIERAGLTTARFEFCGMQKLPQKVQTIFHEYFSHLGGVVTSVKDDYVFPSFVTSQVIQEIIHNTCFVCGGLMKDSTAYKNDDILHNERIVWKDSGIARQIKVRKCSSCGHSHT